MQPLRFAAVLAALLCACARAPDPRYGPSESLLEVVAVLRHHVPDDTYRFAPARDFTGRNVYRASLLRLENLERAHAASLRAGAWEESIAFAKGRALERLRAYGLAAAAYRRAARTQGALQQQAQRSAALCESLAEIIGLENAATDAPDAAAKSAPRKSNAGGRENAAGTAELEQRRARLAALRGDVAGTHYEAIAREEIEHADVERALRLSAARGLSNDGNVRALAALQRNAVQHRESKNANLHLLRLADLYAELAREYVRRNPPESLGFDPPRFAELVEAAARLYESVSNQDGALEKLEAARRLEAFLAFTLQVDRDRFSP